MTALVFRAGPVSLRLPWRLVAVNLALAAIVTGLSILGVMSGSFPLDAARVMAVLKGGGDELERLIVLEHRVPRVLTALGVGLALGLAGEMVQTLLRNPLASPDVIGFTAGAGAGAVLAIAVTGATSFILVGAVAGGLAAALLVLVLAWDRGMRPIDLVLIGIGISLTLSVVSDLLMSRIATEAAADLARWLMGSFNTRNWTDVASVWLGLLVLAPVALWQQFGLGRLTMQDDVAIGLGVRLDLARLTAIATAVGLVAAAIAAAGPLPFVAFVAGPIAHGLSGASRPTLTSAALVGAVVALSADLIGRNLPGGPVLPAGVFTAMIGAPVLLWVLLFQARKQSL